LTRKGPLIEETYDAFRQWSMAGTLQENRVLPVRVRDCWEPALLG